MLYIEDIKEKTLKQQKLLTILKDPRFRSQFTLLGDPNRYWRELSEYLSRNILVIDKLYDEYKKDELANLKNEADHLRKTLQWLDIITSGYRNGKGVRDTIIMRKWEEGRTKTEIANEVGITRQGVSKVLKRLIENKEATKSYYYTSE